ncbi:phosphatase PAP2 family protein [Haloarcula amylovorans]|uniref:phosphatase PAP2 family protein n=1 Tax=Haloarcula amylovorans TaxID=2562280 RepID=UPI001075D987|nr:phosphatase PAP2 family protein [Halomicroarcula amylolytica]
MSLLSQAMTYYPYVFHPITVLGVGILVLIHHEWTRQDGDQSVLWRRVGGFLGVGLLALIPTVAYFGITGANPIQSTMGNSWRMDALVAVGLFIAGVGMWYLWRHFDWGQLIPGAMVVLIAVTIPYIALSPFWNVSGHVIISLMPALYLALVDRKFWPFLAIPIVMVYNRIFLDAHTWAQSIGGFVIAAAIILGLYWLQTDGSLRSEPESTTL